MGDNGQSDREVLIDLCTCIEELTREVQLAYFRDALMNLGSCIEELTAEVRLASLRIATAALMGPHNEPYVAGALRTLEQLVNDA